MSLFESNPIFANTFPGLSPCMLFPKRMKKESLPFPFNAKRIEYFYQCRAAIYAVARFWNLKGAEVIFPSYCCGVDLNALLAAGVLPRFYPVHRSMDVDPNEVAALINRKTKAVYIIHYLGFPGPIDEIARICKEHNILLIEDCALSLFSFH